MPHAAKKHKKSLFIFRRDLRLEDNTALLAALENSEEVVPAFIFDPRQVEKHPYRSSFGLQFMLESLQDLNDALEEKGGKLFLFRDQPEEVIRTLAKEAEIDAVYLNLDYTPFSRKRDAKIESICVALNIQYLAHHDCLLHAPGVVTKDDGKPYTVYTPFMKKAIQKPVTKPQKNKYHNYSTAALKMASHDYLKALIDGQNNDHRNIKGGRTEGKKIAKKLGDYQNYTEVRDIPSVKGTTLLSAHFKFGTISIREAFYILEKKYGRSAPLIRQLFWRDFLTNIGFHFPHVFKGSFRPMYDAINWENDKKLFKKWCLGQTGFPIVDAGMRELNTTGFMHNRVRMVVASFLVKDLHIDWRWGEKYFATKLVDYDPAVNNGNWQWAASTGCDAQPYFRIFNPWLQQKRFDPECHYIKKWVLELNEVPNKEIHKLFEQKNLFSADYPAPIVNHKERSTKAKLLFQEVRN